MCDATESLDHEIGHEKKQTETMHDQQTDSTIKWPNDNVKWSQTQRTRYSQNITILLFSYLMFFRLNGLGIVNGVAAPLKPVHPKM